MSTTNSTGSSLPMPSCGVALLSEGVLRRRRDRDPAADRLPTIASLSAGVMSAPAVSDRAWRPRRRWSRPCSSVKPLPIQRFAKTCLTVLELGTVALDEDLRLELARVEVAVPGHLGLHAEVTADCRRRQALAASVVAGPGVVAAGAEEDRRKHEQGGQSTGGASRHGVVTFVQHEIGREASDRRGHPTRASQPVRRRLTCRRSGAGPARRGCGTGPCTGPCAGPGR